MLRLKALYQKQAYYAVEASESKTTAIAFADSASKETAYKLERKLFDNGHAAVVPETLNTSQILWPSKRRNDLYASGRCKF